ncbi:MAG: hypothetical protein CL831_09025 [Crocinitomicaceae bacterium]|nr:hypothetical protein [Crocinitomicaceae bacterium]|tara:strand:+ start:205 stop:687 length:483 start_codon:yes stop_codon:yes gene_type:complete
MAIKEIVADYPRPPRIEIINGPVVIVIQNEIIAQDCKYIRVCEKFHPPSIYIKPSAFTSGALHQALGRPSICEWKGIASYWNLSQANGENLRKHAGWSYEHPSEHYSALKSWISVYPRLVDYCYLEGERVVAQPGQFYGGWITSSIQGPFKGDPQHPELI